MTSVRHHRLPAGPDAGAWLTVAPERTVLAVVHHFTALTRLVDILTAFDADPRVQVVFTVTGSSAFEAGVEEQLTAIGAVTIPWGHATARPFDLAVAASHGGDLHEIDAPLVIAPHGIGYNKYLRAPSTEHRAPSTEHRAPGVFGLSAEWLMHDGRPVPAALVLSHHEQLDRLRRYCPPAVAVAAVAGDPCLDRLEASQHLRAAYRAAFGVRAGQRLVVLSSTWGANSLFAKDPRLPGRFAARLPADRYRVAAVLHPNVWHGHSPWQLRSWLARAERGGVLLVPPWESWRVALLAADVLVGDHGSVSMYGAAIGRPVLMGVDPPSDVDPASPIARFTAAAPRLDDRAAPAEQIEEVIARPRRAAYRTIVQEATSEPGNAAANLRTLLYRQLRLPEPPHPATTAIVPVPPRDALRPPDVTAHFVHVRQHTAAGTGQFRIDRYPAELRLDDPVDGDSHLLVELRHHDPRLLSLADVVVARGGDIDDDPVRWARQTLDALPGAALAAFVRPDARCLVTDRAGTRLLLSTPDAVDPAVLASVAHVLVAGRYTVRSVVVDVSGHRSAVTVEPDP